MKKNLPSSHQSCFVMSATFFRHAHHHMTRPFFRCTSKSMQHPQSTSLDDRRMLSTTTVPADASKVEPPPLLASRESSDCKMKLRPPWSDDHDADDHNNRQQYQHEELTPLMLLPRHAGDKTPPLAYYHYGDKNSIIGTSATLRAENHSPRQQQQQQQQQQQKRRQQAPRRPPAGWNNSILPASSSSATASYSSSSSSQFVAQLYYSHRNGSTYIRYQPLEEKSRNDSDSNNNNNDNNNKLLSQKNWHSFRPCWFHCSQHQRRCSILSATLIGIILLFWGAGRAVFHNNNDNNTTATATTTSSSSSFGSGSRTSSSFTTSASDNDEGGGEFQQQQQQQQQHNPTSSSLYSHVPRCAGSSGKDGGAPCFYPGRIQVQPHAAGGGGGGGGFPSYWDYAGPMNVTTDAADDGRGGSILINGNRVLLIGGSMHPTRATRMTWELALDEAVRNGLNLVTIDIFWSAHQPYKDSPMDWSMSSSLQQQPDDWQLKDALYSCASRGLFVHLRIVAASGEYSLGGIPEWLAVPYPTMQPSDEVWQTAVADFIKATMDYVKKSQLWAPQGGPIIMAQVENGLPVVEDGCSASGGVDDDDDADADIMGDDLTKTALRGRSSSPQQPLAAASTAATRDHADSCEATIAKLVPIGVVWITCRFSLSANNVMSSFHGEPDGDSGLIHLDQPSLWTLDDGGFQQWGGGHAAATSKNQNNKNNDWRKTAAGMSYTALQLFARGGTHLNYYMWWGGYNRGRSAAAASMLNAHDTHAVLCPSGERHQPKFAHFQALHAALAEIAPVLLLGATSLKSSAPLEKNNNKTAAVVQVMNDNGQWAFGGEHTMMFVYKSKDREVMFVENNLEAEVVARVPCTVGVSPSAFSSVAPAMVVLEMQPHSSILLIDGMVRFDSGAIQPRAMAFARRFIRQPVLLLDWATWQEPVGVVAGADDDVHVDARPLEQTALNNRPNATAQRSDYAWYQTTFTVENHLDMATLRVDTQKSNGIVAFLDGKFVDAADNHERSQGAASLYLSLGSVKSGTHQLALLSESFGYNTLMTSSCASNQNADNVQPQLKGITSDVVLSSPSLRNNMNLVDAGHQWLSFAGLHGERATSSTHSTSSEFSSASSFPESGGVWREHLQNNLLVGWGSSSSSIPSTASWSAAYFDSPRYDPSTQGLFLRIRSGRGHVWLNGRDLGRYWNITRTSGGATGGDGDGEGDDNHSYYSQQYYFLPNDYLYGDSGKLNEIVLFDVFGGDHGESELVLSWTEATSEDEDSLRGEVDFPNACLV
jgi:Glycosyl hydrolases family 35